MPDRPDPFPKQGSKARVLLNDLLNGVRVTPAYAVMQLNLPTFQARCAELRRLGWPVRTMKETNPFRPSEKWDVYFMDAHFRGWIIDHPGEHPAEYPDSDGRGKFVEHAA